MKIGCAMRYYGVGLLFLLAGCSMLGGDIVKVTEVNAGKAPLADLSSADKARLEEIRKTSGQQAGAADAIPGVDTAGAQHMTAADYVKQHPEAAGAGTRDYVVGGNDVLTITVYDEKDLSNPELRVSADGYISFPLIGRLKVAGLTTAEIEKLISTKLAQGQYMLNAHVSVQVKDYNSTWFLVLGAVDKPGGYPLAANERILNAISKAGGIKKEGAGRRAKIVRTENPDTQQARHLVIDFDLQDLLQGADQRANLFLADRDTLFVPTPENFYIIGEVKKPGAYPLPDRDITLVEGIGIAGGFTNIAARNSTRIIRSENGREKVIEVRVDAITGAGKMIREVILQPNDIIIVPESFF